MAITVQASNGVALPVDSLELQFAYDDGNLISMTTIYSGITYVKTIVRDGSGYATSESEWEAQP